MFFMIVLVQGFYFFYDFETVSSNDFDKTQWLAFQKEIDSVKFQNSKNGIKIHPFNPNYISDFKGYKLGMSVAEIDRLHEYRKQNKFVNSAEEFQKVTKVSDSLLRVISHYFKFPDWVNRKKQLASNYTQSNFSKKERIVVLDINEATKEDLMKIYGIGDKISDRILEQREKLGGFVSMEQMSDVWGLSPGVLNELNANFEVKSVSKIKKININNSSIKELSQFPFFRYATAKEIVTYRSMNGDIQREDLLKIKGFPIDKIKIIALYLDF